MTKQFTDTLKDITSKFETKINELEESKKQQQPIIKEITRERIIENKEEIHDNKQRLEAKNTENVENIERSNINYNENKIINQNRKWKAGPIERDNDEDEQKRLKREEKGKIIKELTKNIVKEADEISRNSEYDRESMKGVMKKKTGKTRKERMQDPEVQKEMLKNRTISGVYTFSDKIHQLGYVGSYELDFLQFYDNELHGSPLDLTECPFTFTYIYENEKHFYIPDYYIPNLNLIIEIKDGKESNQTNQAIIDTSHVKETLKDQAIKDSGKFNFIKIRDKNYDDFIQLLELLKDRNISGEEFEPVIVNPER